MVSGAQSATERLTVPPSVRESDPASVARYLLSFDWPMQDLAVFETVVKGGLPLWLEILRLVPQPSERGRLLELGSPPFDITLLLQKFRNYELTLTAATADGRSRLQQSITSALYGEEHRFDCVCFDLERERFPFPDGHFDLVTWCEVIEHLTENPVLALSEVHRVLRPGGAVIISTPNVARVENVVRLWLGLNVFDPYHLGSPLRGSRHSREYTLPELTELLGECGFRIDVAYGRDLNQTWVVWCARILERILGTAFRTKSDRRADHLLIRATKSGPFRWGFPATVFDPGHLLWYRDVRDSEIVFGRNDIPHTTLGWGPIEIGAEGRTQRRASPVGDAYVLARRTSSRVVLEVAGTVDQTRVEIEVLTGDGAGLRLLARQHMTVPIGRWSRLEIAIDPPVEAGTRVQLRIIAAPGVDVHRIALES